MKRKKRNQRRSLKRQLKHSLAVRRNVHGYKPTATVAAHWFSKLNATLFGNRLGRVHIEVKRLVGDWGRCIALWDNRKTPKGRFDQRKIPHHIPVDYYIQLRARNLT